MVNQNVTTTYDEFTNTTITKSYALSYKLTPRRSTLTEMVEFTIRHASIGTANGLFIDMMFNSAEADVKYIAANVKYGSFLDVAKSSLATLPVEWAFFREGEFIIKTDDETIRLSPVADDSGVSRNGLTDTTVVAEQCTYEISQDILYTICEGKNVRLQLSGGRGKWNLDGANFVLLAKAFYNGFYDSSMYNVELQQAQSVSDKKSQIKKIGCAIEVMIAIIFLIYANVVESWGWDDETQAIVTCILLIFIAAVAIIRRIMIKKIQ